MTGNRVLPQIIFPTDYNAIISRVKSIDPLNYAVSRNYIDGAVTYLSPYISRGVISVKQVRDMTLERGFTEHQIDKFLQELAWREYFQQVWRAKGNEIFTDLRQPQPDYVHTQLPEGILNATTGIHAIDQLIQDFYETGYMHNHIRMYVASIACNIGRAHWSTPSRWMYAHLLDGDLASNMCSWQWVAGAFSGKKYYCNQENINRHICSAQPKTYLDANLGELAKIPVPAELKSTVNWQLNVELPSPPLPDIDTTKPTLIYNSYNLDPKWRKEEQVNRVLLLEPSHFQRFPVTTKVLDFIIALSRNINGIQLMTGEVHELISIYGDSFEEKTSLISKEHPAFSHYPGIKDDRDWMYPEATGYFPSFSAWRKKLK